MFDIIIAIIVLMVEQQILRITILTSSLKYVRWLAFGIEIFLAENRMKFEELS